METLKLDVTHSELSMRMPELKFDRGQSILSVKASLEKRVGTSSESMQLVLKDTQGNVIATMDNNDMTLGDYGAHDGYIIHVVDTNPMSIAKQFEDLSQVQKYEIEEDKYKARSDTFVKFKEKNPIIFKAKPKIDDDFESEQAAAIKVVLFVKSNKM